MVCQAGISDGCLLTDSTLKPHQGRFNRARQVAPQTPDLDGEFVNQMQQLRHKVYRKVKHKKLNGKVLTGEMFLELCQTYVAAINEGSVPSINSAWSSLCES